MSDLTLIQKEIASALEQLKEKSLITEAVLAKKVREKAKIQGKNKQEVNCKNQGQKPEKRKIYSKCYL